MRSSYLLFLLPCLLSCADSERSNETSQAGEAPLAAAASAAVASPTEIFLKELTGTWYGEIPGVYRICTEFGAVKGAEPWALQRVKYRIREGTLESSEFTISRNATGALQGQPVYFATVAQSDAAHP